MEQKVIFHLFGGILTASLFLPSAMLPSGMSIPASAAEAATTPPPVKGPPPKPATAVSRPTSIVTELDSLSRSAEEIFNLALAGKMDRIGKKLDTLRKDAALIDYIRDEAGSILLPRLEHTVADLENAMAARNRLDAMRYANRITLIAATVAIPFKPSIPTEVSLLDYSGRELEIWSEGRKIDRLSGIVIRMHLAWQTLMPKLIEHNGARELRRFSEIMGHLELAKTPEEYDRLARLVLVETDSMRVIFARRAK